MTTVPIAISQDFCEDHRKTQTCRGMYFLLHSPSYYFSSFNECMAWYSACYRSKNTKQNLLNLKELKWQCILPVKTRSSEEKHYPCPAQRAQSHCTAACTSAIGNINRGVNHTFCSLIDSWRCRNGKRIFFHQKEQSRKKRRIRCKQKDIQRSQKYTSRRHNMPKMMLLKGIWRLKNQEMRSEL